MSKAMKSALHGPSGAYRALYVLLVVLALLSWARPSATPPRARTGQWTTFGHDPQRSGWAKEEQTFTPQNVSRLGLVWNAVLPNEPRALNGLTAPLVVADVPVAGGRKTLVVVAGSSNHLFALAADTGAVVWQADLPTPGKLREPGDWLCPNALNATPVIDAERGRVFALASDGQLHTLALADGRPLRPPRPFVPPYAKMWSLNYVGSALYTTLAQDCNRGRSGVYVTDPDAPGQPVTVFRTSHECGGGFCGAGSWGRGGPAIDFKGFVYAATGDGPFNPETNAFGSSVVRLEPKTLKLADYYTPPNWQYITKQDLDMGNTTPVLFRWHGRVLAATGGKEGAIYLMDTSSMGGADHHTAVYVSPRYSNDEQTFQKNGIWGGMSSWQDAANRVWLYVPTWGPPAAQAPAFPRRYGAAPHGSVMAFQVAAEASGKPALRPAWISRDIVVPDPVAIAGGVVFALGTGEDTDQVYDGDIKRLIKDRSPRMNNHAVLYALDAETGQELWNSGSTIADWTHFSGLGVGDGKVFAVTHHGGVYAFGLGGNKTPVSPLALSKRQESPASAMAIPARAQPPAASPVERADCAGVLDLFKQKCALCHSLDGKSSASTHTPDLADRQWQAARTDAALIEAIANGKEGEGRMPAFKGNLTDDQIVRLVRCVIRGFAAAAR